MVDVDERALRAAVEGARSQAQVLVNLGWKRNRVNYRDMRVAAELHAVALPAAKGSARPTPSATEVAEAVGIGGSQADVMRRLGFRPTEVSHFRRLCADANVSPFPATSALTTQGENLTRLGIQPPDAGTSTKRAGDVSEAFVAAALTDLGFKLSKPMSENCRYDWLMETADGILRVQVKTARKISETALSFNTASVTSLTTGAIRRGYHGDADLFAVYSPEMRRVYLVPVSEAAGSATTLRLAPSATSVSRQRPAHLYEIARFK